MQINRGDFTPLIEALESIKVSGSKDVGTLNNIFQYIVKLIEKAETPEQEDEAKNESTV